MRNLSECEITSTIPEWKPVASRLKGALVPTGPNKINNSVKVTTAHIPAVIPFPDLSAIGDAFTQATSYISNRQYASLDAEAQDWLASAGRRVIKDLRDEFKKLHYNRDNPMFLPAYALNPDKSLYISFSSIPYALMRYRNQFEDYLHQLLKACGFNALVSSSEFTDKGFISVKVTFPELSKNKETKIIGNLALSTDFQKEFFCGVDDLKMED